jgi:hypothetical protein
MVLCIVVYGMKICPPMRVLDLSDCGSQEIYGKEGLNGTWAIRDDVTCVSDESTRGTLAPDRSFSLWQRTALRSSEVFVVVDASTDWWWVLQSIWLNSFYKYNSSLGRVHRGEQEQGWPYSQIKLIFVRIYFSSRSTFVWTGQINYKEDYYLKRTIY